MLTQGSPADLLFELEPSYLAIELSRFFETTAVGFISYNRCGAFTCSVFSRPKWIFHSQSRSATERARTEFRD